MGINKKALGSALHVLDESPKKIATAKAKYQQDLNAIREKERSGNYSPNYISKAKQDAKAEHDRVVKALVDGMKAAYNTVLENNDYSAEEINLDDKRLQTALSIVNTQGKNLPHNLQVKLLNQFRGDFGALSVLEGAFRANGLYFEKMAHEMQTPIKESALNDMATAFSYYDFDLTRGIVNFDEKRIMWSKGAYAAQAERLGLDLSGEDDSYLYALNELKRQLDDETFSGATNDTRAQGIASSRRWAIESAAQELANAKNTGKNESEIFNSTIKHLERLSFFNENSDKTLNDFVGQK